MESTQSSSANSNVNQFKLGALPKAERIYAASRMTHEFEFVPPLEAPIYSPSPEEWKDPLAYIRKIRPSAEKFGICKIKPPTDWQPPFAVDVDHFKFTPRIQRLNELEARTRVKLNFLDSIAKFWELQGSTLKIPLVERKALDLYTLHRVVQDEGGYEATTKERKWSKVAVKMGYLHARGLGSLIRHHYDRILYPFDVFSGGKLQSTIKIKKEEESEKVDTDYKPHGILSRQAIKPPTEKYSRRSKRFASKSSENQPQSDTLECIKEVEDVNEINRSLELKRLDFFGAGPKIIQQPVDEKKPDIVAEVGEQEKLQYELDPLAKYICLQCGRGDTEESMLLCDGCDDSYHTFCLKPPLLDVPKGDWRCPKCIAVEVSKPLEAFGFEQATREYTLQQFGEMADQFKSDYFNKPVHLVPLSTVEREFWRIVSTIDEDVTVEYGADLHTMEHGSGFPTKATQNLNTTDQKYAESEWNLNNLPVLKGSVLAHINADISGMKVPWMYVGMCFSAFCWHNEDHWSYSINYLHWGEPKTWYGVPGSQAEAFEATMHSAAPELFLSQPDLLHQLVTIMNPNILVNDGVSVCRTDQQAGEFVITFPRAYHAGFNQGYNFAEAVNFAPADWLQMGRECIAHYSHLRRFCVFSHDELVCNMALNMKTLDVTVTGATCQDMEKMVEEEKVLRKRILDWGVIKAEQESFETLMDDERLCDVCKTTCFLAAVTCECSQSRLCCLRHYDKLCDCPPAQHTLRYRYTMDELPHMLEKLQDKDSAYKDWVVAVTSALDPNTEKVDLDEMKSLVDAAKAGDYPQDSLLENLAEATNKAENCAMLAQKLMCSKVRTRNQPVASHRNKLTVPELTDFYDEIMGLACVVKEGSELRALLDRVKEFQVKATGLLECVTLDSRALQQCIDFGFSIDIDLPEMEQLKHSLERAKWLENAHSTLDSPETLTLDVLKHLLITGAELPPTTVIEEEMVNIQEIVSRVERFEERAKHAMIPKNRQTISMLQELVDEGEQINAHLQSLPSLQDSLKKAIAWTSQVEDLQGAENFPYLEHLNEVVTKGRVIPLRLESLPLLESNLQAGKSWKERTARTFLRKNSSFTLMEALSPREEVGIDSIKGKKRNAREGSPKYVAPSICDVVLTGEVDSTEVVKAFRQAEDFEMIAMLKLRLGNVAKDKHKSTDTKFCICRRPMHGYMRQCELCMEWFHATCVPVPKSSSSGGGLKKLPPGPAQQLATQASKDLKFLCPCCLRSRRPRLETILSLLVSLQKLSVRIPEGEALQCLTERAMNWQDRARQILATEELSCALAKLSVLSQRLIEAAAREKTEKIINSELKKAASNLNLQGRMKSIASQAGVVSEDSMGSLPASPAADGTSCASTDAPGSVDSLGFNGLPRNEDSQPWDDPNLPSTSTTLSVSEHAYSAASKQPLGKAGSKKHVRKTPLVPRPLDPPPMVLSPHARETLEELMFEGDLLEVSLDELQLIFRIIQAARPEAERRFIDCDEAGVLALAKVKVSSKESCSMVDKKVPRKKERCSEDQNGSGEPQVKRFKKIERNVGQFPVGKTIKGKKKNVAPLKDGAMPRIRKKSGNNLPSTASKPAKWGKSSGWPKREAVVDTDSDDDDDDSDEKCAVRDCKQPLGSAVDWVQCDGGCQAWFHLHCLGMAKSDLRDGEDFFCAACRSPPAAPTAPTAPAASKLPTLEEEAGLDALLSLAVPRGSLPLPEVVFPLDGPGADIPANADAEMSEPSPETDDVGELM